MLKIITVRLIARLAVEEDASSIYQFYSGRRNESEFLARKPHQSAEKTKDMLGAWSTESSWDYNSRVSLVIEENASKTPFGLLTLFSKAHQLEFHFGLSNDFSGKGYASEIIKGLIRQAKLNDQHTELTTYCDIEHSAARRVITNQGMKETSILKNQYINPNQNNKKIDCIGYTLSI